MYAASLLGLAWSYVQPAMRFGVYYFVMGFILKLHKDIPYFALHLFTGIVVVHYFSETWSGGTRSIWQNKALVQKMRMPREIFPVAAMLVAAYHTMPQLLVLVLCCRARRLAHHLDGRRGRAARAGHPGHVLDGARAVLRGAERVLQGLPEHRRDDACSSCTSWCR